MRKTALSLLALSILVVIIISACNGGYPTVGFTVVTEFETIFYIGPASGSITSGELRQADPGYSGDVLSFNNVIAASSGRFDINNGRADGRWFMTAIANWAVSAANCNGQSTNIAIKRFRLNYLTCTQRGLEITQLNEKSTTYAYF